jgi:hypothetical protein
MENITLNRIEAKKIDVDEKKSRCWRNGEP